MFNDAPRQLLRNFWKFLGRPASTEVAMMSELIHELLESSFPPYARPDAITLSYPGLRALYHEEILDTAKYLGLHLLALPSYDQPHELVAAYVGHGMGLCPSYSNVTKCREENYAMQAGHVMVAEYTDSALVLSGDYISSATDIEHMSQYSYVSFELGTRHRGDEDHLPELVHFVSESLTDFVRYPDQKEIKVIFTGTMTEGDNTDLQAMFDQASMAASVVLELFTSMPEFVAARGAAELSWRALMADKWDHPVVLTSLEL